MNQEKPTSEENNDIEVTENSETSVEDSSRVRRGVGVSLIVHACLIALLVYIPYQFLGDESKRDYGKKYYSRRQ